jgi:general secretion pathway protein A
MSYYSALLLEKEPFSTSPDPAFFYDSRQHHAALVKLMIEIRLKRGLSLVLGDAGTGKTTLSRKLFQMLKERDDIVSGMILDPVYDNEQLFLDSLARTFKIDLESKNNILDYKEAIKKYLFRQCLEENKTVVLLIDEAQKLNGASLEFLRVLLNYETNEFKMLQLVLLSQLELLPALKRIHNFWDRISMKYVLNPLDEQETERMIHFRLKQAGYKFPGQLFTPEAIGHIYRHTKGYPRQIAMICHEALKRIVAESRVCVDVQLVRELIDHEVFIQEMVVNG